MTTKAFLSLGPGGMKLEFEDADRISRDWPEDANDENGNYCCVCRLCGNEFTGHKRRFVCKVCCDKESINKDVL
jgi:hypothetical protein